jgi:hypothetical protein
MTRLLLVALVLAAPAAFAQPLPSNPVAGSPAPGGTQATVGERLQSVNSDIRSAALQDALSLAYNDPTAPAAQALVPELFRVMREDGVATHRLMAAQALLEIGDRNTHRQVARLGQADADRQVQRLVGMAVSAKRQQGR